MQDLSYLLIIITCWMIIVYDNKEDLNASGDQLSMNKGDSESLLTPLLFGVALVTAFLWMLFKTTIAI